MEDLKAGLEKIDNRFGQFAKQLHDNFVTVAALKRLTAEELQEDFEIPKYAARSIAAAYLTSDALDGTPPKKKAKISYTDEELCMALARWGRGSAQKRQMSYPPAGPSAHRPAEAGVSGSDPQRASSSSTPETGQSDSEPVLHVASSPIAEFERTKVFVRDSYKDIFLRIWRRMLLWIKSNEAEADASTKVANRGGTGRFTVTGLPGLGKSVWIFYAIAMFFQQSEIHSVFLQQGDVSTILEFTRCGIITHSGPAAEIQELIVKGTAVKHVLIFDGMKPQTVRIHCPVILVTSPRLEIIKEYRKSATPDEFNMPMWDLAELQAADSYEPKGGASIEEVIAIYGAKPRHCLPKAERSTSRQALDTAVADKDVANVIDALTKGKVSFQADQRSHVLVGYDVDKDYKVTRMFFASEVARDACLKQMEADNWTGIEMLLKAASATQTIGKSPATLALEAFVWNELVSGRSLEWKPLNKQAEGLALSRDVFKARSIQKFDGLKNVEQDAERVLQVPRAANLEAVDSLMGDDICFQALKSNFLEDGQPKLVFAVPRAAYGHFKEQPVTLGLGKNKKSPVKSGEQLKVSKLVAQFVLAIDFVRIPTISVSVAQ